MDQYNKYMEYLVLEHPFISAGATIIIFMALALSAAYFGEKITCEKKTNLMNIESNYGLYTGCMVKIDGRWQPFNEYVTVNK